MASKMVASVTCSQRQTMRSGSIWADVLARTLLPETEVPIGILVSMVGAPVFIYMMMRKSYGFGGGE